MYGTAAEPKVLTEWCLGFLQVSTINRGGSGGGGGGVLGGGGGGNRGESGGGGESRAIGGQGGNGAHKVACRLEVWLLVRHSEGIRLWG